MQKKRVFLLIFCFIMLAFQGFTQNSDTLRVRKSYVKTPLLNVLKDFETEYRMTLKYDSTLISRYRYDYLYMGMPRQRAFDEIFSEIKDLAYYIDNMGVYCIVSKRHLPKDWKEPGFIKYEGNASRFNLTVTGRITDKTNGEPLPFASVSVENHTIGAVTNVDGYFILYNVPSDTETLIIRYLGYESQNFYLSTTANVEKVLVALIPALNTLDEVVIVAKREDVLKIPAFAIGVIQTTAAKIADLPALGEKDLFRTFQLMPGISASNESSAGMYVRGGTPDQNLVLYDDFTIYHQEHLMGVFSSFNTNAVKSVQLHKGGFDAKYGGRLSSVMEIAGKTGNDKHFNIGGDIGFLGFNAFAEMPFKKDKGTIFVAGRRSFQSFMYEKFTNVYSKNEQIGGRQISGGGGRFAIRNQAKPKSYFYDLNAKVTYNPTKRDIIALSFFNGEDILDNSRNDFGISSISGGITDKTNWGNIGSSLKWSRNWDNRLFSNALVSFSNYYSLRNRNNNTSSSSGNTAVIFDMNTNEDNNLWDYSLKLDNEFKISNKNKLEFGLHYSNYRIDYRYSQSDSVDILNMRNIGNLVSTHFQDKLTLGEKLTVSPGIRLSYFDVTSKIYTEPRLQTFFKASEKIIFKASAGYYNQFVNRIVREDISASSRDIWLLSDNKGIPVSGATHYVAGGSYETKDFLFDVEAYYKKLNNISEYTLRFVRSFLENTGYQEFFYNGKGYSRGIDFLLQKKYGKLTGWMAYTLGETRYNFPIYSDYYYPANQDVTHEFKTVMTYKPSRSLTFSLTWIYATGKPYTEPVGAFSLNMPSTGRMDFIVVDKKNNARYPDYHRMDLMAKYDMLFIKYFQPSVSISLFNLYDHKNVWYSEYTYSQNSGILETNVNLLGFTPNITLSFQLK